MEHLSPWKNVISYINLTLALLLLYFFEVRFPLSRYLMNVKEKVTFQTSMTNNTTTTTTSNANDPIILIKETLLYGIHLQENLENITYDATLTLNHMGHICFEVLVHTPTSKCPYPYIRIRLSGVALVHIRLQTRRNDTTNTTTRLEGCSYLPISGIYFVDANLLHCHMWSLADQNQQGIPIWENNARMKEVLGRPIYPNLNQTFVPYTFVMPTFHRQYTSDQKRIPESAWVYAPLCHNNLYTVAKHCQQNNNNISFLPTKFQINDWIRNIDDTMNFTSDRIHRRLDGYMWLPINFTTGIIDYSADHFGYEYTPLPSKLQVWKNQSNDQSICFVGASHARYIMNQVIQIYYNLTYGKDGCDETYTRPIDVDVNFDRFSQWYVHFAHKLTKKQRTNPKRFLGKYASCHIFIVTFGQWDAGWPGNEPTTPTKFRNDVLQSLDNLQSSIQPSAKIYVLSVNQNAMGIRSLLGDDWRIPPVIDAYNDVMESELSMPNNDTNDDTTEKRIPYIIPFRKWNQTVFWMDNTDIMDPIWDSATDFVHPCRYGFRPMALRILDLLLQ
jgi:hypothetical protein